MNRTKPYRTKYLAKKVNQNGETTLVQITVNEWKEIIKQGKNLPVNQRRHFISDEIEEEFYIDQLMIEVSYSEYLEWDRKRKKIGRDYTPDDSTSVLSLDENVPDQDGNEMSLYDVIKGQGSAEDEFMYSEMIEELRSELKEWNSWALVVLETYLNDEQKNATNILRTLYGISEKNACKHIKQFEIFIKNFLIGGNF